MANQNTLGTATGVARDLHMHFGDQRAGRIKYLKTPALGFGLDSLADTVGTENDGRIVRNFVQLFNKDRPAIAQTIHDIAVMDDLVAHINRAPNTSIARSTISIARSTPAQKPRGLASWILNSVITESPRARD